MEMTQVEREKIIDAGNLKVAEFLTIDEIKMFLKLKEEQARYEPVPEVDYRHIHDLNTLLERIHSQCPENGHRWCARINDQIESIVEQTYQAYCR